MKDVRGRRTLVVFLRRFVAFPQFAIRWIDLRSNDGQVGKQILHFPLFAMRILRLVGLVVLVDLSRRDADRRCLATGWIENVANLGVLGDPAILGVRQLWRD